MALNENDLVKVVDELRLKGYTDNFIIQDNLVFSTNMNQGFVEDEVIIEGAYQFDISEDAFDTQNLFAVFIPKYQLRGLIIDLLGMYFYLEDQPITKILRDAPLVSYVFNSQYPDMKYGLKKITPSEFNADSNRYVLRIGFPDFPECPAGTAFTMLGFDKQTQQYVWLATSILKKGQVKRIEFNEYNKEIM